MRLFRPIQDVTDSLLAELKRIGDSLQKQTEAAHESENPEDEQQAPAAVVGIRDAIQSVGESYKTAHSPKKWYKDRNFWVSVVGVAVVAAYATVATLQWNAIQETNRINRQAIIENQRPWVTPIIWEFPFKVGSSTDPCVNDLCIGVYVSNSGRSPALNATYSVLVSVLRSDPPPTENPGPQKSLRGIMPADYKWAIYFTENVTQQQAAEHARGARLYIQARIEYCDSWNNLNWTSFCMYQRSGVGYNSFAPCDSIGDRVRTIPNGCQNYKKK
jgi:hypothetical protein